MLSFFPSLIPSLFPVHCVSFLSLIFIFIFILRVLHLYSCSVIFNLFCSLRLIFMFIFIFDVFVVLCFFIVFNLCQDFISIFLQPDPQRCMWPLLSSPGGGGLLSGHRGRGGAGSAEFKLQSAGAKFG